MKHLIIILFLINSAICFGQTEPSGLPVPNAPTGYYKIGNIQPTRTLGIPKRDTTYTPSYDGQIVYRPQDALLYYYDSVAVRWKQVGVGSGTLTSANNGLSLSGTTVQLGGTLIQNTSIDLAGDSLSHSNGFWRLYGTTTNVPIGLIATNGTGNNISLTLRSRNGTTNKALVVDTGDVVIGAVFNSAAFTNNSHLQDIANASSTQKRTEIHAERAVRYSDTVGGTETFSAGIYGRNDFFIKASASLPSELTSAGVEAGLFLRKNSAYTGTSTFTGASLPTNTVSTMPSALVGRLDLSGTASGGNDLLAKDWWAVITATVKMAAFNRINKVAFINTGAVQQAGNIDTAYGVYINPIASYAPTPYAINQVGTADTNYLAGYLRLPTLTSKTDTTAYKPMAVDGLGNVVKFASWTAAGTYVVGRNLRIISGSPNLDTLATIDTLISATPALSENSTKVATTAWVIGQGYGTGGSTAAGSTGDVQIKGSTGLLSTAVGSYFNIDSTNKKFNIGNPASTPGGLNLDSVDINLNKSKYLINGISVLEQNSAANQLEVGNAAALTTVNIRAAGNIRMNLTNTVLTISTPTVNINSLLQTGGVDALTWTGTDIRMGSIAAGFNTFGLYVAGSRKAELTSGGTLKINSTSTANEVAGRGLYVNRSIGANKDSVNTISSITSQFVLVQDTAAGDDQGKFKKIAASALSGGNTIYTGDGTVSSNRTVTGTSRTLIWDNFTYIINRGNPGFVFRNTGGNKEYTHFLSSGADNNYQFGFSHANVFDIGQAYNVDTLNNFNVGGVSTTQPLYTTGKSLYAAEGFVSAKGNFYKINNITTNTTIDLTYYYITIDATGGNVTITLPAASSAFAANFGIQYVFKRMDASGNTVIVQRAGADTIDGATSFTLTTQYQVKELQAITSSTWAIR